MWNIFKREESSKDRLLLKLTPGDPQKGQISINTSVTEEQWRAILAILDRQSPMES